MAEANWVLPGNASILCAPVIRLKPGVAADVVCTEPPCSEPDALCLTCPAVPVATGADGNVAEDGDDFNIWLLPTETDATPPEAAVCVMPDEGEP